MAAGIFVSYRRDDVRQAAGRLADDLSEQFGAAHIFRDIEGIELGVDFVEALDRALNDCVVMLVLIGPRWIDMCDAQGRRRLDDPRDWIRQEIATAFRRGIRVVPVLIDGTPLPSAGELPEELQPLVRRQAFEIADSRWRGDLLRLTETLARLPGLQLKPKPAAEPAEPASPAAGRPWIKRVLWGIAGLGVVGYVADEFDTGSSDPVPWQVDLPVPMSSTIAPVNAPGRPQPANLPVEPRAAAPPDLSGLWRADEGETYQITQHGNRISLSASSGGVPIGSGQGRIEDGMLRLTLSLVINGVPLGAISCNLQGHADWNRLAGPCQGPSGPFQGVMYR